MTGAERIAAERTRQVEEEGYDQEHDDQYHSKYSGLIWAAICYAARAAGDEVFRRTSERSAVHYSPWPWASEWDKRDKHPDLRCLEIAGALIAAEIDRRLREEQ